jgi:hypothetical protein
MSDFRVLRDRNKQRPHGAVTCARLTMIDRMATLYSAFAAGFAARSLAFWTWLSEWGNRGKPMFCDVFRHFAGFTVAKRRQWVWAVFLGSVLLSACASVGGLSANAPADVKRKAVAERAEARWQRLIARDLAGAYEYMSPASRATMPLDLYKAKHKVGMYRSVKVDDVNCEADVCTVKLSLTYDYKRFKGVTTPLTERWIISQGQAWFVNGG